MPPPTVRIEDPFARPPAPTSGFALFNYGFRPFFFAAGLFAVASIAVWLWVWGGGGALGLRMSPIAWHAHEMLFGYTVAAIAGFFLTVVPNWTRAKAQKGPVLVVLAGLWSAGRVAVWAQGALPYGLVMAADLAFLVVLTGVVARPLLAAQHRRQIVFVPILLVLFAGNVFMHLDVLGFDALGLDWGARGQMLGLDGVVVLIAVMGGRVTPSFTSSFLGHQDPNLKVRQSDILNQMVLWATWGVLALDLVWPESPATGAAALLAALLHAVRLAGWQGLKTLGNPILWVLHLGYLWLAVGLAVKGLADFDLLARAASLHVLTIGAIGTMTLAIMTRASLGHTGRAIKAKKVIVGAYGALSLAVVARVGMAVWPDQAVLLLMISGGLWMFAFAAFFLVYAPILTRPRVDGRPG